MPHATRRSLTLLVAAGLVAIGFALAGWFAAQGMARLIP